MLGSYWAFKLHLKCIKQKTVREKIQQAKGRETGTLITYKWRECKKKRKVINQF
jgi:hypothetical protein